MRRLPLQVWLGGTLIVLLFAAALLAPALTPFAPNDADPGSILLPPSLAHPAGTDQLGRDEFSRILYGGRASLSVAAGIVVLSVGLGGVAGAALGLLGGWTDLIAMRLVEVAMAIPSLVIALAVAAALGPSLRNLVIVLGLLGAPFYIRLFRTEARALRERPFIQSARVMGASYAALLFRHVIPNLLPLTATFASAALGSALVSASALSFVGLGAQPPTAEWGALIYDGRNTLLYEWWCAVLPGVAIAAAALGFVLLGDGLRRHFDPTGGR